VGLLLLSLAPVACGGGRNDGSAPGRANLASTSALDERLVVVRCDLDQDLYADLLTIDVARPPYRVIEALQGTPGGTFVDVSSSWQGRHLGQEIDEVLETYFDRSLSTAAETELDVLVRGQLISLAVFE
jgi:hypothetical protein